MNSNNELIDEFVERLYLGKLSNEQEKAENLLCLVDKIITKIDSSSARGFLNVISNVNAIIQAKMPWETTSMNMCHKVEKIIKDEYNSLRLIEKQNSVQQSKVENLLDSGDGENWDLEVDKDKLKNNILEVLQEQISEIEQCQELISIQGESKIHHDEIIMTCGYCPDVLAFFLRAAKKRKFHIIIAEGAPRYDVSKMAKSLCSINIQTTVIQDSAIFAFMSRVNKVIIGCRTVSRNGGIIAFVGATMMAAAAKYYSVPVYVCAATYKFSPEIIEDMNIYTSPSAIVTSEIESNEIFKDVNFSVAQFDYVPPESITSFITNNRGVVPSYVYRQVLEIYQPSNEEISVN